MSNTCMKKMPQAVKDKLDDWFGGEDEYRILQVWDDAHGAFYFAVVSGEKEKDRTTLHFPRLFMVGDKCEISMDDHYPVNGTIGKSKYL